MAPPLIDRSEYDHPEHFDDVIREYRASERYVPTPLEDLLFELAGHRCTICHAPWLEIHHIQELKSGGATEYDNLIVLCPNCHTRVHSEDIPNKKELRQYKQKQEIAYELPILARLSESDWEFVKSVSNIHPEEQVVYSQRTHKEISTGDQDEAIEAARRTAGCLYLQECGIVSVDLDNAVTLDLQRVSVTLRTRLTSKGIRWVRYVKENGRIPGDNSRDSA